MFRNVWGEVDIPWLEIICWGSLMLMGVAAIGKLFIDPCPSDVIVESTKTCIERCIDKPMGASFDVY